MTSLPPPPVNRNSSCPVPPDKDVVAGTAGQQSSPAPPIEQVVAVAAIERIVSRAAVEQVVALAAVQVSLPIPP